MIVSVERIETGRALVLLLYRAVQPGEREACKSIGAGRSRRNR
jgi:hypothetical protein